MSHTKSRAELASVRRAALEDLMLQTDEQLREEAAEEGLNLSAMAHAMRAAMHESAAYVLRERLQAARALNLQHQERSPSPFPRPSIESIKATVREILKTDGSLALAFREGRSQTEADWNSLYDDLVSMGAIGPHDGHR